MNEAIPTYLPTHKKYIKELNNINKNKVVCDNKNVCTFRQS